MGFSGPGVSNETLIERAEDLIDHWESKNTRGVPHRRLMEHARERLEQVPRRRGERRNLALGELQQRLCFYRWLISDTKPRKPTHMAFNRPKNPVWVMLAVGSLGVDVNVA